MRHTVPRLVREHESRGRYVRVRGQRVFVRVQGEGPPVLLLHGVPTSSFLYRDVVTALASRGLRAVAFDFPGTGLSDKPYPAPYDWHALAGWIEAVVHTLGLGSAHLVVHDIAGPIGAEWAILHPERTRSITFMNTLLDVSAFHRPFPMWTYVVPGMRHAVFASQNGRMLAPVMRWRGVKRPQAAHREMVDAYVWLLKHKHGRKPFLAIMGGFDLTAAHRDYLRQGLLRLGVPMQLVWGEHDNAIPVHQLNYIRTTFPIEAEHYLDARHFLQEDLPEQCARHIAEFCLEHEA